MSNLSEHAKEWSPNPFEVSSDPSSDVSPVVLPDDEAAAQVVLSRESTSSPPPQAHMNATPLLSASAVQAAASLADKSEAKAIVDRAIAEREQRIKDAEKVKSGKMTKEEMQAMINAKMKR